MTAPFLPKDLKMLYKQRGKFSLGLHPGNLTGLHGRNEGAGFGLVYKESLQHTVKFSNSGQ